MTSYQHRFKFLFIKVLLTTTSEFTIDNNSLNNRCNPDIQALYKGRVMSLLIMKTFVNLVAKIDALITIGEHAIIFEFIEA